MFGIAIVMGIGLIGGMFMISSGSKNLKPITFPNSFYKKLIFFKLDGNRVLAVKENQNDEVLFTGSYETAEKYFQQVQQGFEDWLEDNDHFTKSGSEVKFT